jgi:hypothetical protein
MPTKNPSENSKSKKFEMNDDNLRQVDQGSTTSMKKMIYSGNKRDLKGHSDKK